MHFTKTKKFLVCLDSDGCVMDTMDIKHKKCFGPVMVLEWELTQWQEDILQLWDQVNLYTMTRGVNRFKALSIVLKTIHETYCEIEDLEQLLCWVRETSDLSNTTLQHRIAETDSAILKKTLRWSFTVNQKISAISIMDKPPFAGAREAIVQMRKYADIAVVSNANTKALEEEWTTHGLISYVDVLLSQDAGNKAYCVGELLKKGYDPDCVLMCGDAPGDLNAAKKNGILFYPLLVKQEAKGWDLFLSEAFTRFLNGSYKGEYEEQKIQQFLENLGAM